MSVRLETVVWRHDSITSSQGASGVRRTAGVVPNIVGINLAAKATASRLGGVKSSRAVKSRAS